MLGPFSYGLMVNPIELETLNAPQLRELTREPSNDSARSSTRTTRALRPLSHSSAVGRQQSILRRPLFRAAESRSDQKPDSSHLDLVACAPTRGFRDSSLPPFSCILVASLVITMTPVKKNNNKIIRTDHGPSDCARAGCKRGPLRTPAP